MVKVSRCLVRDKTRTRRPSTASSGSSPEKSHGASLPVVCCIESRIRWVQPAGSGDSPVDPVSGPAGLGQDATPYPTECGRGQAAQRGRDRGSQQVRRTAQHGLRESCVGHRHGVGGSGQRDQRQLCPLLDGDLQRQPCL